MQELLAHPWVRSHMRRNAAPHMRGRTVTQGEVPQGLGLQPVGGGAGSGGGFGLTGSGGVGGGAGLVAAGGSAGAPGSLSMPGSSSVQSGSGAGGGGGGGWGGARMQSSGGISKAGLMAGVVAGEGHNSSCPNILTAQVGLDLGGAVCVAFHICWWLLGVPHGPPLHCHALC
jgi:hypothetical protein